jgi:uncharacterized protein YcbK (DUF882 family)
VSRFFTPAEQACRCGCGLLLQIDFAEWLDKLRVEVERPLRLTSAARCAEYDAKVGGKGAHTTGRAADILAVSGEAKFAIVAAAMGLGAGGVGVGGTFVHVDRGLELTKFPRPMLWTYPPKKR